MSLVRSDALEHTVSDIQRRFGMRSLHRLVDAGARPPVLPTGYPALDAALGIGGLPRGRVSELIGYGSAGQMAVAARMLALVQQAGEEAVYVDAMRAVDLDALARGGVRFDALTILRPHTPRQALEALRVLVEGGGAGAILFDRVNALLSEPDAPDLLAETIRGLNMALSRSLCALVFLTEAQGAYPAGMTLPHYASIRLVFEHQAWRIRGRHVAGYTARVTVVKNKLAAPGGSARIDAEVGRSTNAPDAAFGPQPNRG